MQITTDPAALAGSLCLGLPEPVAVQALEGDWPSDVRLVLGSLAAPLATIPLAVAGAVASATIPAATVAAAHAALDGRPVPVVLIAGAGAGLDQIAGGRLWWRQESWGTDEAQSLGSVAMGPAGPTAVSADAGNAAGLGSDGLIFVSPTAGSAHIVRDEGAGVTDRPALDFRGAGVTVSDDPGSGATRVTIPGGGASSLDGLTDVATAGADPGEALVFDGTGWVPSAASVVLGTDPRLTDARPPTAHTHTLDDTTDTASRLAMTPAERAKLAGVATGATANATDAALRDRSTHTGTQAIATVTGLQSVLDGKQPAGSYAPALGLDDNYVSDGEKLALHSHSNKAALDAVSGTNTGDQTLPTWTTIAGKPAVVADGATQAEVRASINAAAGDAPGLLGRYVGINAQEGTTYTPALSDEGKLVAITNGSAITVTLPVDATVPFPTGACIDFTAWGVGMITAVVESGGQPLKVADTAITRKTHSVFSAIKVAADTWQLVGDLA